MTSQISGDSLASFQNTSLRSASAFVGQMNDRAAPGGSITTARLLGPIQLAYNGDGRDLRGVGAPSATQGLWAHGIGLFDHADADSSVGSPSSPANTGGFQVGHDHSFAS